MAFKVVMVWLSLALFVACLTALFMSMRTVMDVGGMCASGGAYEIATPCPSSAWLFPVSIWVGLAAGAVYVFAGRGLPGPKWIGLAWPALFLSLGWNFWEYGLNPPGVDQSVAIGWIVCGVVFVLMGAVPLVGLLGTAAGRRWLMWSDAPDEGSLSARTVKQARDAMSSIDWRKLVVVTDAPSAASATSGARRGSSEDDLIDRLERLTAMYRRGDLTSAQFEAAKTQLLGGAS